MYNAEVGEDGKVEIRSEEVRHTVEDYKWYLYMYSTKTQYPGPQAYEMINGLFRYVAKTYLAEFIMIDEVQFWETGDKEILESQFARNKFLIDSFVSIANAEKRLPEEDIECYLLRIIGQMKKQ
ncbi:MAG: hypothetical protein WCK78_00675 [Paludibacter sp.]